MSEVEDFLAHHGVIGMKWGVRRSRGGYQRKNGDTPSASPSKTAAKKAVVPAGKDPHSHLKVEGKEKHADGSVTWHIKDKNSSMGIKAKTNHDGGADAEAKVKAAAAAHIEKLKQATPKPKPDPVKVMTNEELENAIRRIQMEKQYSQLMREMNTPATPKQVSAKKKAADLVTQAVAKGAAQGIQNGATKIVEGAVQTQFKKIMENAAKNSAKKAVKKI